METSVPGSAMWVDATLRSKVSRATKSISRTLQWRLFITSLIFTDLVTAVVSFRLAYYVRFDLRLPIFFHHENPPSLERYLSIMAILLALWLVVFAISGLYERKNLLGGTREYSLVFNATTIVIFMVIAAGFLEPDFIIARGWLLLVWGFMFLNAALGRFLIRRIVYALRYQGFFITPALIVGSNDEGLSLAQQLLSWYTSGLHVLGFVDEKLPAGTRVMDNLYTLGSVDQLDRLIKQYDVGELILASSAISSREKMTEIFTRYGIGSGVNVRMSSGLYEIITTGLSVKEFAYVPLVGINQVRLTGIDSLLKGLLDYILIIPGLILLAPFLLLIAVIIKLDSPGPVLHRRRVMGVNGRQFDAYKFRTMRVDGDAILAKYPELKRQLETEHKLKNDPRITRVGAFLRRWSLDELPQVINVLKYEMSVVGPRMISPAEMEMYKKWGMNLLTVRPGITGLWQVTGRSDVTYDERVRLDMRYIRNWSIWLDIQLLLKTIPAVLKGRGAY